MYAVGNPPLQVLLALLAQMFQGQCILRIFVCDDRKELYFSIISSVLWIWIAKPASEVALSMMSKRREQQMLALVYFQSFLLFMISGPRETESAVVPQQLIQFRYVLTYRPRGSSTR